MTKRGSKTSPNSPKAKRGKAKKKKKEDVLNYGRKQRNDPQEGRTKKAILSNGQRCFEKGKIQTRRGRGLKNKGIRSNCQRMSLKAIEAIGELGAKIEKSSLSQDV